MKQFLQKCLLLIPVALSVMGTNYLVDPAQIVGGGRYEREAATLLLQGHNVLTVVDYDVRLMDEDFIQGLPERRDVVVIGTSRTRQLRGDLFAGRTFFNSSVDGATLQDEVAVYQLYREHHLTPAVVVLAADPFLFNEFNDHPIRDAPYEPEYYRALASFALAPLPQDNPPALGIPLPASTLELFSPGYFQASLQNLFSGAKPGLPRPIASETDIDETYPTVRPDGSWSLSAGTRATSPAQVRTLAVNYANKKNLPGLGNFRQMEPQSVKVFEALVRTMRREGVEVIFFLAPYHPAAYEILMRPDKAPIIAPVESYLRAFARENQVTVAGSYNPAGYMVGTDFYDGIHPTEAGARKVFMHRAP